MLERGSGKRLLHAAAGCLATCFAACATPQPAGVPEHCEELSEWRNAPAVMREILEVHEYNAAGEPVYFTKYLERFDYLESQCCGVNAYRNDHPPEDCEP